MIADTYRQLVEQARTHSLSHEEYLAARYETGSVVVTSNLLFSR